MVKIVISALMVNGVLALTLLSPPAQAQESLVLDGIVAVVNDGVLLRSELNEQIRTITAQLRSQQVQLPEQSVLEKQILERMVIDELLVQRADRLGIDISDDMVNAGIARVAQRNNVPLNQLPEILESQGVDYIAYRDSIRRDMQIEQLRNRDLIGRMEVTKEEAERFLAEVSAADNNEYEISQIMIPVASDASPADIEQASAKIEEILTKLEAGENFGAMAVAYSAGQQALSGGKIGWRKHRELPTLFAETVAKLNSGDHSEALRSNAGFHIVRLDQKRGDNRPPVIVTEFLARHILVETNEIRTDAAAEGKALTLYSRVKAGEDFSELARTESDDRGSATSGGELGWTGPGTFVPPFEAKLRELSVGELSQPVKSRFGWHIIELMDKRDQDKTSEARLNEAAGQIRMRKAQDESESWIMRLRDDAFVEYRL